MKAFKSFILFYFIFSSFCLAQWNQSIVTSGKTLLRDAVFTDSNILCAFDFSRFYLSIDGGISYTQKDQAMFGYKKIQIINDSTYFLTIFENYLLLTSDSGNTWTKFYIKDAFGDTINNDHILVAYFYSNGKAMLIANYNKPDSCPNAFTSDNFGLSWNKIDCSSIQVKSEMNPAFSNPYRIFNFDNKLFMESPYYYNKLIVVFDYGKQIKELNWNISGGILYDFAFKDSLNGIIIFGEKMYKTTDGAQSVSQLFSPPPVFCGNISYAKPVDSTSQAFYMAAGSSGAYISKNDGQSWSKLGDEDYNYIGFGNSKFGIASVSFSVPEWYYFVGLPMGVPNEIADKSMNKIYPNPASNVLHIETTIAKPSFTVSTILGQQVNTISYTKSAQGSYTLDINNLAAGNYILSISDGERKYFKKFIVSSK